MKVVVTIVGQDRVGIIAMVSGILAEHNVNILNVNQNIMDGFFNMVMIVEMTDNAMALSELQRILKEKGEEIHLEIKAQHQDIFNVMHTV
ncbi:MAG: ACT domain-containing protein [Schwartzia sp. (in: firmicutes)]